MPEVKETTADNPTIVTVGTAAQPTRHENHIVWTYDDGFGETNATIQCLWLDAEDNIISSALLGKDSHAFTACEHTVSELFTEVMGVLNAFSRPVLKHGPDDQTLEWMTFAQAMAEGMTT